MGLDGGENDGEILFVLGRRGGDFSPSIVTTIKHADFEVNFSTGSLGFHPISV